MAELRTDMYSQYGGCTTVFTVSMMYESKYYDKPIYRFADYNSGRYSSRNAAFQSMLNKVSGSDLALDGDLLLYTKDSSPLEPKVHSRT